ncbi:hypothetical protein [Modestobacter sp. VKM Ac-2985]|uniref:hypothetical protein n=1 Tax=Modestobacter sp. VKM Ac-2985 TaxID=3004139 RepID=UPI0022ABC1AD|nr:hypothetical protein [Modestobacter sp. VKM Ac-2985]MCZ2837175.1 hypothetical protein [Modestobacter sp. VKM Ac-2985]
MTVPTPAGVRAGRVVRLLGRHRTWTSGPMVPDAAEQLASDLTAEIEAIGDTPRMLSSFTCEDGRIVRPRARDLTGVETQSSTTAAVHP